ncbi:MAG: hypothetical protein ACFBSD_15450, partial [Paracoccaceae bacterium]
GVVSGGGWATGATPATHLGRGGPQFHSRPNPKRPGHRHRRKLPSDDRKTAIIVDRFGRLNDAPEQVIIQVPPPVPPEPTEPARPAETLDETPDPGAPATLMPARGFRPAQPAIAIGERLPRGLPHVTLDWRAYDMPWPGPGLIYARVGSEIVVIEPESRRVVDIVKTEAQG